MAGFVDAFRMTWGWLSGSSGVPGRVVAVDIFRGEQVTQVFYSNDAAVDVFLAGAVAIQTDVNIDA